MAVESNMVGERVHFDLDLRCGTAGTMFDITSRGA
jgi:hypothetical protein